MTIKIKPTSTTATIEHNDSTILTVDSSGNITPSNDLYPKVPAFRSALSADQSITTATITKIQFDIETFDTSSDYDNSTNYRYTPSVAGYYQVNATARSEGTSISLFALYIHKNGVNYLTSNVDTESSGTAHVSGSTLVYMNGTTDYLEVYGRIDGTSPKFGGNSTGTNCEFSAHLVSV